MNTERPDEKDAKRIVEQTMSITLEHTDGDINGSVDYQSPDGLRAVEVTRLTDGRIRAGRKALDASRNAEPPETDLQSCWLVIAPDTQSKLNTFLQRVLPALAELELAGETRFHRQRATVHVIKQGNLSHIYQPLLAAGVEIASAIIDSEKPPHTHHIILSLGSGGTASGSDEALGLIINELNQRPDNPKKLHASGVGHRHLFVWVDGDTRFDIARPLSAEAPAWHDGFGLPSSPPALDPAITHLWVVHQGSRLGWFWDGLNWQEISA